MLLPTVLGWSPTNPCENVRDAAQAAHITPGQLIQGMLQVRRRAEFWTAVETEVPDEECRDELLDGDAALFPGADEYISAFENRP